jgi:hypothetical protein
MFAADFLKGAEIGASVAFLTAGFFSIIATRPIPPFERPLLNAKILQILFFLFAVVLNIHSSWDLEVALFRYWRWIN